MKRLTTLLFISSLILLYSSSAQAGPSLASIAPVKSSAYQASLVLKPGPGDLITFHVHNSGAAQYILLIDAASLPVDGAVTLLYPPIKMNADSNVSLDFAVPIHALNGIVVCNSSTAKIGTTPTKTIGTTDCFFFAEVQ